MPGPDEVVGFDDRSLVLCLFGVITRETVERCCELVGKVEYVVFRIGFWKSVREGWR